MENLERLKKIFGEIINSGVDPDSITRDTAFVKDLGLNSIGMLYMAMAIEEEFGVTLANENITQFVTVKDVLKYLD